METAAIDSVINHIWVKALKLNRGYTFSIFRCNFLKTSRGNRFGPFGHELTFQTTRPPLVPASVLSLYNAWTWMPANLSAQKYSCFFTLQLSVIEFLMLSALHQRQPSKHFFSRAFTFDSLRSLKLTRRCPTQLLSCFFWSPLATRNKQLHLDGREKAQLVPVEKELLGIKKLGIK